ncbi:L-threonylcarbamoyladenylate synthase [Variovorax ureilyticus]|uniref:L-threonylcarbamoyladenylate synthase n=1 Tax=Variovorax ureilyticus TaxID=1836198 RepID=UPI003BF48D06
MIQPAGLLTIQGAAAVIRGGGVVAYPTEGVFGLGCDPMNAAAVRRVADVKQRSDAQGFVLISSSLGQLERWVDLGLLSEVARKAILESWPGPITWVVPAKRGAKLPASGGRTGIAVRVTAHRVASRLCEAVGGPIVSTSANPHGAPPARSLTDVLAYFPSGLLDGVVNGKVGINAGPCQIRDALTLAVLRW